MNDFPDHASIPAVDQPAGPVDPTQGREAPMEGALRGGVA